MVLNGQVAYLLAQDQEGPNIRSFRPEDYRGQNQNWKICQSPNRHIHSANSNGLLSFNGVYWQQRQIPSGATLRSVASDQQGRIYVGAFNEFGYFPVDPYDESSYVSLSANLEEDFDEEIWNIIINKEYVIFQSFAKIFVYDGQKVEQVEPPNVILFIQADGEDFLVPVIDSGLYRWEPNKDFHLLPGTEALAGQGIRAVVRDGSTLIIATERGGIYRWQDAKLLLSEWEIASTLAEQQINQFHALASGGYAIGTILSGLYILDENGALVHHLYQANGLQNNTVIDIHEDLDGDLWLGLDRGIDLVRLSDPLRFFNSSQQAFGTVYAATIYEERLYLGTNQGLFQKSYTQTENEREPIFSLVPGTQGQVWSLLVRDGQLLCGHNEGTFRIGLEGAEKISTITGGWQFLPIVDREDQLLQATYTGLVRLDKQLDGSWTLGKRFTDFLAPIRQICALDEHNFLVSHASQGLFQIELNKDWDSIVNIIEFGEEEGLAADRLFRISPFPEGIIVQSAEDNWLYQEGEFQQIEQFRGEAILKGASILNGQYGNWFQILPDRVWLYQDSNQLNLPLRLAGDYPQFHHLATGEYLFCLDEGYAILEQDHLSHAATRIQARIRWYYFAASDWEIIDTAQNELTARQNHLRFRFTEPSFAQAPRFRFRLEGFDNAWSAWSTRYEKEYTNLPAGDYQFFLQTEKSRLITSVSFSILPPWYRSTVAYLFYVLLLIMVLVLMYRWHRGRLKKQAHTLDLKRARELEQERIQLRNEQLQNDIMLKTKELANSTYSLVRKNEILLKLKQELRQANQGSLTDRDYYQLREIINKHLSSEQDWEMFESNFNSVHEDFFKRLKKTYPQLTPSDQKLAAYLRMNLSSKEIAPLFNISLRGVENKRYRLRKKLELRADANLNDYLMNF